MSDNIKSLEESEKQNLKPHSSNFDNQVKSLENQNLKSQLNTFENQIESLEIENQNIKSNQKISKHKKLEGFH